MIRLENLTGASKSMFMSMSLNLYIRFTGIFDCGSCNRSPKNCFLGKKRELSFKQDETVVHCETVFGGLRSLVDSDVIFA